MRVSLEEAFSLLRKWQEEETPVECWCQGDLEVHVFGRITRADSSIIQIQSDHSHLRIIVPEGAELNYDDSRVLQSLSQPSLFLEGLLCIRFPSRNALVVAEMYSAVWPKENV